MRTGPRCKANGSRSYSWQQKDMAQGFGSVSAGRVYAIMKDSRATHMLAELSTDVAAASWLLTVQPRISFPELRGLISST